MDDEDHASPAFGKGGMIIQGYRPGLVGRVTEMHAAFYSRHVGFGQFFESQVATGVAEFVGRLDKPYNGIWAAISDDRIIGSITIDGEDLGQDNAHLRWFILDENAQGRGLGRQLLSEAIMFCDRQNFAATRLWTFRGLDAARHLYESFGFRLVREAEGQQWGSKVTEQEFMRPSATNS